MSVNRKKRIFIGSSSETKELASKIKKQLVSDFDCSVWYDNFFELGNYVFNDLIQKAISYDYAILIGGTDDKVIRLSTMDEKLSPRDNIYLEYGMFSGILSTNRILFLLHENCRVASDLTGMTLAQYKNEESALEKCVEWVNKSLSGARTRAFSALDIELLPTVGISVGYFFNFVEPFIKALRTVRVFEFEGKEYKIHNKKLVVNIPTYLEQNPSDYKITLMETEELVDSQFARYRIMINPEELERGELIVHDVPNTLLAVFKTIEYIFGSETLDTEDSKYAKYRALDNFYDNLCRLIVSRTSDARYVEFRRYNGYDE